MQQTRTTPEAALVEQATIDGPKRVLFFGKAMSRTRATRGLIGALRAHGLEVTWFNPARARRFWGRKRALERARRAFDALRPDLVFSFCRDLPRPLLDEFRGSGRARIVVWGEEALPAIGDDYLDYLRRVDAVFLTDAQLVRELHRRGVSQAGFVLEGFDAQTHFPAAARAPHRRHRVVYIGGPGRDGCRVELLTRVAQAFDLQVFGKGWGAHSGLRVARPVRPKAYRRVCADADIVLGTNQINDHELYFSNRTLFSLACQAFHLTHYVPRLEEVFEEGRHLAWFRDADECVAKIEHYLGRDDERGRIAAAGRERVVACDRFEARIGYILGCLARGCRGRGMPWMRSWWIGGVGRWRMGRDGWFWVRAGGAVGCSLCDNAESQGPALPSAPAAVRRSP